MTQPWEAEHEVSPEAARELIESQFPELSPAQVTHFSSGWDNVAYLVNDELMFRFPQRQLGADCMESEIKVLPRIADRLPLAIPKPEFIGTAASGYPWPFAGYRFLSGRTACSAELSNDQRSAIAERLANFLRELHSVSHDEAIRLGAPPCVIGRLDLSHRIPRTVERIAALAESGLIDDAAPYHALLKQTEARFGHANFKSGPDSLLVHGDLYVRHLLVDEAGNLSGVIDWGDVHYGAAANDLMIAHSFLPPKAHSTFRHAYGSIDDDAWLLARFRALHHTAILLIYADSIQDANLLAESKIAMSFLAA